MYLDYPFILSKINRGQYKMEQQTPISTKSRVKVLKSQKACVGRARGDLHFPFNCPDGGFENVEKIISFKIATYAVAEKKPEKNSTLPGFQSWDTGAAL